MRKQSVILLTAVTILFITLSKSVGQTIYTFAGTGVSGFSGDGGVANLAQLNNPQGVAVDGSGNVYIADYQNNRIRKVNSTGIISTFAGTGVPGFSGDGGAATSAQLDWPNSVAVDGGGNVYISDSGNERIRKVNPAGIISTFAGTGVTGFGGDGGPATSALLFSPLGLAADASGNVFISDIGNQRIRQVNAAGIISTFAGTGIAGFNGDGSVANLAQLNYAKGIAVDVSGNLYIADDANCRIRKVNTTGIISTFAGTGVPGFSGDGSAANLAQLNNPNAIAVDALGNVYIADYNNNRIRKINTLGIISTFAGSGGSGFSGDGGLATLAQFNKINGVAVNTSGNVYINDRWNGRVRIVCSSNCLANINSLLENNNEVLIYPNPNNGSFKVKLENEISNCEIILINCLGQKIHEQKISQGKNNIITNGLANGLYNYIILQDKEEISNGKLAIE